MKAFSQLSDRDKEEVYKKIKEIAEYNKTWFFSKKFIDSVIHELKENINNSLTQIKHTRAVRFRTLRKKSTEKHLTRERRKLIADQLNKLRKLNPP